MEVVGRLKQIILGIASARGNYTLSSRCFQVYISPKADGIDTSKSSWFFGKKG